MISLCGITGSSSEFCSCKLDLLQVFFW